MRIGSGFDGGHETYCWTPLGIPFIIMLIEHWAGPEIQFGASQLLYRLCDSIYYFGK